MTEKVPFLLGSLTLLPCSPDDCGSSSSPARILCSFPAHTTDLHFPCFPWCLLWLRLGQLLESCAEPAIDTCLAFGCLVFLFSDGWVLLVCITWKPRVEDGRDTISFISEWLHWGMSFPSSPHATDLNSTWAKIKLCFHVSHSHFAVCESSGLFCFYQVSTVFYCMTGDEDLLVTKEDKDPGSCLGPTDGE